MVLRKTKRPAKGRPPSITGFVPSSSVDSGVIKEASVPVFSKTNQDSQAELKGTASCIELFEEPSKPHTNSSTPSENASIKSNSHSELENNEISVSTQTSHTSVFSTEEQTKPDQDKISETSTSVEDSLEKPPSNKDCQEQNTKFSAEENKSQTMATPQNNALAKVSKDSYKEETEKDDNILERKSEVDEKKAVESRPSIEFAPWNVPLVRRRQTMAHVINLIFYLFCNVLVMFCVVNPLMWPLFIPYLFYISRDTAPENGTRASSFYRNLTFWKWYADFYPTRIVKEAELDSSKNYIFGYHPHGIIGMGAFTNFATNATGVDKVFPNIFVHLMTLAPNFKFPFYREHILSLGITSVSKKSIRNILSKGSGSSCMIVVGGAEEALEAKPDRAHLILAHRYGFVKMAIECGADLVPVFGFGENQLYDQANNEHDSWLYYFQQQLKKFAGFTLPLFYGRGVFNYNLGIFPRRIPLTVVTGAPINVTKCENPTDEQVQKVHHQYLEALSDLYDRNKAAYWVGSDPPELKFL